jgi:hypothetical protein
MLYGQKYGKHRSLAGVGVGVDNALVLVDDLFADGKPHARTGVFGFAVKALEDEENAFGVFLFKPYPVVGE